MHANAFEKKKGTVNEHALFAMHPLRCKVCNCLPKICNYEFLGENLKHRELTFAKEDKYLLEVYKVSAAGVQTIRALIHTLIQDEYRYIILFVCMQLLIYVHKFRLFCLSRFQFFRRQVVQYMSIKIPSVGMGSPSFDKRR